MKFLVWAKELPSFLHPDVGPLLSSSGPWSGMTPWCRRGQPSAQWELAYIERCPLSHPREFTLMPEENVVYWVFVRQSGSSLQDREAGWHLRAVLSTLHTHTHTHTHPIRSTGWKASFDTAGGGWQNGLQLQWIGSVPAACIRNNPERRDPFYFVFLRGSCFSFWAQRLSKLALTVKEKT